MTRAAIEQVVRKHGIKPDLSPSLTGVNGNLVDDLLALLVPTPSRYDLISILRDADFSTAEGKDRCYDRLLAWALGTTERQEAVAPHSNRYYPCINGVSIVVIAWSARSVPPNPMTPSARRVCRADVFCRMTTPHDAGRWLDLLVPDVLGRVRSGRSRGFFSHA